MNIYVGNLDFKVNEQELEQVFAEYGNVESARVITDKFSGRSKGFGFVVMENDDEAKAAIAELDGQDINGRPARVNEARARD